MEPEDERRVEQLERFRERAVRDRWLRTLTGGYPTVPTRSALPTASADFAFQLLGVPGGAGVADVVYCCVKAAADTYSWKAVTTG